MFKKCLIIFAFLFFFSFSGRAVLAQSDNFEDNSVWDAPTASQQQDQGQISPTPTESTQSAAQTDADSSITYQAQIVKIDEEKSVVVMGSKQTYQKMELKILKGSNKGKIIIVENGNIPLANVIKYQLNDKVMVLAEKDASGNEVYNISDFIRTDSLWILFALFVVITVIVAKFKGFTSLLSMGVTFGVIFKFILPRILDGQNPIIIAIIGSLIIIPVTFYLAHGFNKKTTIAILGTFVAMIITGVLASVFVGLSRLSGLTSEEAGFIEQVKQGSLNMKGLLLAGMMIGAIGVLDDITVAQAAVVEQLKNALDKVKVWDLYKRSMKIGQDHITSMVNTLVLVYAGASLPLLLIFVDNPHPFSEIINYEFVAEEVIRTMVGSIGLVLAVPITTFLAALMFSKIKNKK
jgi:uncharacterized membrane protein